MFLQYHSSVLSPKQKVKTYLEFQVESAFKKFDQTGNNKLNFREFREMMTKRTETKETKETNKSKVKESEPENVPDQDQ